jgi:predicted type IV restriction endonuclease
MLTLAETLDSVRKKILRIGSKSINEENTRASLIDRVLRALGWDTEDAERSPVRRGEGAWR